MNRPSPPPARIAPIVAVAMTCRVAVRNPPTMIDDASGSSMPVRIWRSRQAHPAAGLDELVVDRAQARIGRRARSGGIARNVIAMRIGSVFRPNVGS